jgi:glutamyl-tRNA synthetase
VNYISLLGWNPKTENDILSMDDLIAKFDFKGLNKKGARFDPAKLASFNRKWKARS